MSALTFKRNRCFADLRPSLSSPASPLHSQRELSPAATLLKKPKQQQQQWRLPPPAPLWRPVHGPQRIVRAVLGRRSVVGSGRGVSVVSGEGKEGNVGMGNIVAWAIGKKESFDALWSSRRRCRGTASAEALLPRSVLSVGSDSTVPTREGDDLLGPDNLDGQVEGAWKVGKVGSVPLQVDVIETRKTPVYKDLLLSARKRDLKLSSLDFEVKLIEKRISEFNKVAEVKPGEDHLGPFTPLTDKEENEVNLALRDPHKFHLCKHEVLVLHESSNIEITREVIQCLSHGSWLNDEVINLYFELLKERERRQPAKFLACHFFNTFFYKKLTGGRNCYDFKAVKRWTTQRKLGYSLIECDKILVPIHKEVHWCLAVIDVKSKELLYLDSLGGRDERVLRILARYFMDEVKDKSNRTIETLPWKRCAVDNLPLQKNGWDCGMFMLKYADFISRGLNLCFEQGNMMYFRKRTAMEILRLKAE